MTEIQDESGWKLIYGDVLRSPAYEGLLFVLVVSGAQILSMLSMTAITLVFARVPLSGKPGWIADGAGDDVGVHVVGVRILLCTDARWNLRTGSIPFFTLVALFAMWFGISVPLNVVGAFVGYKHKQTEYPGRTNQIPGEIPKTGSVPPLLFAMFAGILPFVVVFMELVFTLRSI